MEIDYFIVGPEAETDRAASAKTIQIIHKHFNNVFAWN